MEKTFTCQRFLGLHESPDGATQLKMGEARRMVNFDLTRDGHLRLRPAVRDHTFRGTSIAPPPLPQRSTGFDPWSGGWKIVSFFTGHLAGDEIMVFVKVKPTDEASFLWPCALQIYRKSKNPNHPAPAELMLQIAGNEDDSPFDNIPDSVLIFNFNEGLYLIPHRTNTLSPEVKKVTVVDGAYILSDVEPYVPLVITGASPLGGGTALENLNLLSNRRRIQFSADGTSTVYHLPAEMTGVVSVVVDNEEKEGGGTDYTWDRNAHTVTFVAAPVKGVNNVEITYSTPLTSPEPLTCRFAELYNGASDNRVFLYGNGTNKCFYSGVTEAGKPDPSYFPAMNEIVVGDDAPITGMIRHYGKLVCFKASSTYSITYEPVTLADGRTIGGFYLRSLHRDIGNQAPGQVTLIDNRPRTVADGQIFDWGITSSYYRDERNAKRISDRVYATIRDADPEKIVCADDEQNLSWYCFLNDEEGTVLVHKYALDAWTVWKGEAFKGITFAAPFAGTLAIIRSDYVDGENYSDSVCMLDYDLTEDSIPTKNLNIQIPARWESGYMDFGSDFMRKHSSFIWVSLLPEAASNVTITAQTDRREVYREKTASANILDWNHVDFRQFSFIVSRSPKVRRLKLKVKKFVYYSLIFEITSPGAKGTILGFDQKVSYTSLAK